MHDTQARLCVTGDARMTHWRARYHADDLRRERWCRVAAVATLVLINVLAGCTSATYERPDGTRVSYTSLWKDFEGIDAEYITEQTAATLTVGKSSTHELTAAEREAVRRAVLNVLTDAAGPVVVP